MATTDYYVEYRNIEVKAFGKTKVVQVSVIIRPDGTPMDDCRLHTGLIFSGRCGRTGQKVWPAFMTLWKRPDGSYRPDFRFYKLNRNTGTLIGWAEDVPWTADRTAAIWAERFGQEAVAR